ncbi:MAG: hypothetical protein IH945_04385 [Armatimonadetes bacterium]|nr:hypothetical protein [Armatimonadota bacterium]
MPATLTADLNTILDRLASAQAKTVGTSASGYGVGTASYGAKKEVDTAETTLAAIDDNDPVLDYGKALQSFRDRMTTAQLMIAAGSDFFAGLDRHASRFGAGVYTTIDGWLTDLNTTGTKWEAVQDRFFRDLYNAVKGGSFFPSPENIYFEVLQGTFDDPTHLYTEGLGKFVVVGEVFTEAVLEGSLVAGLTATARIDPAKYAGGVGNLKVSGFAGSADDVTVTGYGFDPATKAITAAGKTWITSVSADGDTAIVVGGGSAPADSQIIEVTGIAAGGNITAGTIYVEAKRPSGRLLVK